MTSSLSQRRLGGRGAHYYHNCLLEQPGFSLWGEGPRACHPAQAQILVHWWSLHFDTGVPAARALALYARLKALGNIFCFL